MSSQYEFTFTCHVKADVSQEVIDTLTYMTRSESESSNFVTTLKHPLFTSYWEPGSVEDECNGAFLDEWRFIIYSNEPVYGEELLSGTFGSTFENRKLSVRKLTGDDDFNNCFYKLMNWLASVCESTGEIGCYHYLHNMEYDSEPVPIHFIDGKAYMKEDGKLICFDE
jgi:hypothetical protein